MVTKRQHFIPRLILRQFAGASPKGHVWTYDAQTDDVRSATPENTAVQSHFYSIENDDGTRDTRVEDHISKIEDAAATSYERLLLGQIPSKDTQSRADFATFLALMYVRTPAMRRMGAEIAGRQLQILCYAYGRNRNAFEAFIRRFEKNSGQILDPEDKEKLRQHFLNPSNFTMQIAQDSTLKILGVADKLAPILFDMNWTVACPLAGYFITTDNPLVRDTDPKTRHPLYGDHGFLNKTVEVIFPLSPQRLLLMSWDKDAPSFGVLPRDNVCRINCGLAANSDRYLYANVREAKLQKLAAKYKNIRPNMTTKGYGPEKFSQIEVRRRL